MHATMQCHKVVLDKASWLRTPLRPEGRGCDSGTRQQAHQRALLLLLVVLCEVLQHGGHGNHRCGTVVHDGTSEPWCSKLFQERMLGSR